MKEFFKELFDYNRVHNQKIIDALNSTPSAASEKTIRLFSHILNAQAIWQDRIQLLPDPCSPWDIHPVEEFRSLDEQNHKKALLVLDQYGLDQVIEYRNSRGEAYRNSVRDILFHVINHGTYHRAQIATLFRQSGVAPVVSDYIFYKR